MLELGELKKVRKQLGLTQLELARKAGVPQSVIAKIETGKVDPSYSSVKKICDVIEALGKQGLKAEDVMNRRIYSVGEQESLEQAIAVLKKHAISQLPVLNERAELVGIVTESTVLNSLGKVPYSQQVKDLMEPPPPTVSSGAPAEAVIDLLKFFPMVLVTEAGKFVGVITKSDLLGSSRKSEKGKEKGKRE